MAEELEEIANKVEAQWYSSPRPSPPRTKPLCRIVLDAPAELLTMNRAKRTHYRVWADLTKAWRDAMYERAIFLGIPPVGTCVGIEGRPYQYKGILADPLGHAPCVKACIDGLRDAGVLEDDTGEHVAWVRCHPPVKGPGAGMILELVPA